MAAALSANSDAGTSAGDGASSDAAASRPAPTRLGQRQRLVELIHKNGMARDDQRQALLEPAASAPAGTSAASASGSSGTFNADLVFREESGGFELWLGSLEDALSLEALYSRGLNGVLNCAVEECRRECACFRSKEGPAGNRGRRRTHARGASLQEDEEGASGIRRALPVDVLRGIVEFDQIWYSDILGYDMAYCGVEAADEDGYRMDLHFPEVRDFLDMCRQEERKVLVHCVMGINRSSVALVAFLCSGLGMDLEVAIDLASKQRGHILSNDSFLDQLLEHFGPSDSKVDGASEAREDGGADGYPPAV